MVIQKAVPAAAATFHPPPPQRQWYDPDVHSWSRRMSEVANADMPKLAAETMAALDRFDPEAMKAAMPGQSAVIDKIATRKALRDHDLCDCNPAGMLQLVWEEEEDKRELSGLESTLADVGRTCLQGDTHRLFSHLIALRRSKRADDQ